MSTPSCRELPDYTKKQIKKAFPDLLERDMSTRRAMALMQKVEAAKVRHAEKALNEKAAKMANRATMDYIAVDRLGEAHKLHPGNRHRVEAFLSNWIGIHYGALNINSKITNIGAVRDRLLNLRRLGGNLVSLLVDFQTNKGVNRLTDRFRALAKSKGILADEADMLLMRSREVGAIAKIQASTELHDAGIAHLKAVYDDYVEEMKGKGFSEPEVEEMLKAAHDIYARMDSVRVIAESAGLDIGSVESIGYVPRIFTPAASKHIKAAEKDLATSLYDQMNKSPNVEQVSYAFQESRKTWNYIPEDEFLISSFLGVPPEKLREMVLDSSLARYIHKNLDPDAIDDLIDTGLLSKVPMFSDQMAKFVMSQYSDLPFKEMSEVLITDPKMLYQSYRNALQKAAGDSLMMKAIVEDGIPSGWAATPQMIKANPDLYKDYVKLNVDDIKKTYNAYTGEDLHIQPEVHGTYMALQEIVRSPEHMSTVASIFRSLGGLLIQSALIQPGYVLRNLGTNIIGSFALGNNLARVWGAYSDVTRVMREGTGWMDDTQKIYRMGGDLVSKKRFFEETYLHNGNSFVPNTSDLKAGDMKGFGNIKRGLGYLINYSQAHGFIRPKKPTDNWAEGFTYVLEQLKASQDVVFSKLAFVSQLNESAFKWSTLMSRADTSAGNRVGQFMQATKGYAKSDFGEEMRTVDNFFYMWDDVGKIPDFTGKFVMPFAQTLMKTPPAVLRHAMTNPRAYINYMRVRQFINQSSAEDENLPEAGVAQWKKDAGLLNLYKDPESGNWVSAMTNSFDPIYDATTFAGKTMRRIMATQGKYGDATTEEQYRFIQEKYSFKDFLAEGLKNAPPITRSLVEAYTGIDVRTGQNKELMEKFIKPSDTFAGVRMNSVVKGILASYPPIDNFNRANIGDMFGTPEVYDPKNPFKPLVESTNSPLTGVQNTSAQGLERYMPELQRGVALAIRSTGIPITVLDTARQTQFTQAMFSKVHSDVKKELKDVSYKLYSGKIRDKAEIDNLYAQARKVSEIEFKMQVTDLRLKLWMQQNNVPTKDVWDKLARGGYNELPPIGQAEADKMALEYAEQLAKIDSRYNEVVNRFKK